MEALLPTYRTEEFYTPGGNLVEIREQNGNDDDVLSRVKDNEDGSAICKFIAGIIISYNGSPSTLTYKEVQKFKLSDIYYILLKSRILTYGPELNFTYKYSESSSQDLVEDLSIYDADLNPDSKIKDTRKPFEYRVSNYPNLKESHRQITLKSGRVVRYKYLTGESIAEVIKSDRSESTKNDELRLRDLELKGEESFLMIQDFSPFKATEMAEIRRDIKHNDLSFAVATDLTDPESKQMITITLIDLDEFFFPVI